MRPNRRAIELRHALETGEKAQKQFNGNSRQRQFVAALRDAASAQPGQQRQRGDRNNLLHQHQRAGQHYPD
ncbi:hypothetical protein [Candidatus Pantoea persica]|uniref:hypothetical protein n=1 Tax=Candidatus Pantoea persica TaxID=2518128 RepID=UPI00215DC0AF|nr:hypothetical protein [Candidatus Pantoea persica]MBA2817382.1 hypothetical protein [Candidatus Pantoea persica]